VQAVLQSISGKPSTCLSLNFPSLRALSLDLKRRSLGQSLAMCIQPYVQNLTQLFIQSQLISMDDLKDISGAFARNPAALTSLCLNLNGFDPATAHLLAERFPGLTRIKLTANRISGDNPWIRRLECLEVSSVHIWHD
jgi:hypothetical protein